MTFIEIIKAFGPTITSGGGVLLAGKLMWDRVKEDIEELKSEVAAIRAKQTTDATLNAKDHAEVVRKIARIEGHLNID